VRVVALPEHVDEAGDPITIPIRPVVRSKR